MCIRDRNKADDAPVNITAGQLRLSCLDLMVIFRTFTLSVEPLRATLLPLKQRISERSVIDYVFFFLRCKANLAVCARTQTEMIQMLRYQLDSISTSVLRLLPPPAPVQRCSLGGISK